MKTIHALTLASLVGVTVFSLVGCGRPSNSANAAPPAATASAPAATVTAGREVLVTANDAMKFNLVEIRATPGEALAITLRNDGTMPKFSMGHNWVLVGANVDLNAFAGDCATAAKFDYVSKTNPERVLAATKLLGPNEKDTVRFHAPKQAGRYPFLCTFPGHLQVGMKGFLIVE